MRNGLLAFTALALANTSAQAQYWPPQQPYYPVPMYRPMVVAQPAPVYYGPPGYYPSGNWRGYPVNPTYVPQNALPAAAARPAPGVTVTVQDSDVATVPESSPAPEQLAAPAPPAPPVRATPYTSAVPSASPVPYIDVMVSNGDKTVAPAEPVPYHRQCNEKWWVGADYLLGWVTQGPISTPLLTTSVPDPTQTRNPGAIGDPGTIVLFGERPLDFRMLNGLRGEVGMFVDEDNRFSVDVGGFYFLPRHVRFHFESPTGVPGLYRPYFSAVQLQDKSYAVAENDGIQAPITGLTDIDARIQLFGGEINGRWNSYSNRCLHTQVLLGFRSVHLEESLTIHDNVQGLVFFGGNTIAPTDTVIEEDQFRTYNRFYGFQFGGSVGWELPRFTLSAFSKVGLGVTDQRVRIDGASSVVSGGAITQTAVGAILVQPSNVGEYNRQVFGVIPEVGVNLGFDVSKHIRLKAGYSCLFWSGVVRPGAQVDRVVNDTQVVTDSVFFNQPNVAGLPRPEFNFRETTFFLQQLNFGVELRY